GERCVSGKCVSIYKKAEVPGVSGKNNGVGVDTGSTGAVFTGDIKGFTPEARIVWNQLDPATQKSIIDMGKSLKEIENIFVGCKGPGAGGCVGDVINQYSSPETPTDLPVSPGQFS
ncbi:MAG: hypothetical protein AABX04_02680, partial [Nanoarchaeota archaeon]